MGRRIEVAELGWAGLERPAGLCRSRAHPFDVMTDAAQTETENLELRTDN
jgi:hypothetical protein